MGCCGGSDAQKKAGQDPKTNDPTVVDEVALPCPKGEPELVAVVQRADTKKGMGGVKIQATGPKTFEVTSANETGKCDFGKVKVGNYEITTKLDEPQLKKWKQPAVLDVGVAKGKKVTAHISIEPIYKLRLVLFDAADKPVANRKWKLTAPSKKEGTTKADGLIEVDIGHKDAQATIEVNLRDARVVVAQPPGPPPPAAYPPTIVAAVFKDTDDKPVLPPPEENDWTWALTILDPETVNMEADDPLRARLHNLGFSIDAGGAAEPTKAAVEVYQGHYKKNVSGLLGDIKDDLVKRHDKV